MKEISYIIYQEGKYYVAQCLNVDVSSFGETIDEAINNLKEAIELYLEGEDLEIPDIGKVIIGKDRVRGKIVFFTGNRACSNQLGFKLVSQKGSHGKFKNETGGIVILPMNKREIPIGTFKSILRQIGISHEDFK